MVRLINSVPKNKISWVINMVSSLSYIQFDHLSPDQRAYFLANLGEEFVTVFLDNALITLLLRANQGELIISLSYLYPLFKLLFIVFGYARLSPVVIIDQKPVVFEDRKNRGAYVLRGIDYVPMHCYDQPVLENEIAAPIPPEDYAFIKQFLDLYPILIGLMGGAEQFPEDTGIRIGDIPPNYDLLPTIADYLWRFNDYSHCLREAMEKQDNIKQITTKINDKVRLLINA